MALSERWNALRQNIGRILLGQEGAYSSDIWVRGLDKKFPNAFVQWNTRSDLMLASVVAPFVQWKMRVYPDARLALRRRIGDEYEVVIDSPFLELMMNPNELYDFVTMMQATLMELDIDGNSFWIKERRNSGVVDAVYWVPRHTIEPDKKLSNAMGEPYYRYTPGSSGPLPVPATDVVHHRFGIDTQDYRLGLSPLASAMREVMTDELAAWHTSMLLKNSAMPNTLISMEGPPLPPEALARMEEQWNAKVGGDGRGSTMFTSRKMDVHTMTTTPKDMELSSVRYLTEERISALLGVPAIVAGTGAGLRHATYANFDTAQRTVWLNTALPALREFSSALTRQLLVEFNDDPMMSVYFDTTMVAALQEDTERKSTRLISEFQGGLITRAEARMDMGRTVTPEDEMYISSGTVETIDEVIV